MRQRFQKRTDSCYQAVTFGTFHSVFYRILQEEAGARLRLLPSSLQQPLLKRLWEDYAEEEAEEDAAGALLQEASACKANAGKATYVQGFSDRKTDAGKTIHAQAQNAPHGAFDRGRGAGQFTQIPPSSEKLQTLAGDISRRKNGGAAARPQSPVSPAAFDRIMTAYQRYLDENGLLDFDDMILRCERLLREHPAALAKWRHRFSYFLVDEFQDVNLCQYETVRLLAGPRANLFVVGDDDQAIYGFRGAAPAVMRRFLTDYPACRRVLLRTNYRCGRQILQAAQRLIAHNEERFPKKIIAHSASALPVRRLEFSTAQEQSHFLCGELAAMQPEERKETAVIFRTRALAGAFAKAWARYRREAAQGGSGDALKEGDGDGRSSHAVKDGSEDSHAARSDGREILETVAAYFRLALGLRAGGGSRSDFYRIMNRPQRFLTRALAERDTVTADALRCAAANLRGTFSVNGPYYSLRGISPQTGLHAGMARMNAAQTSAMQTGAARRGTEAALHTLLEDLDLLPSLLPPHAVRYLRGAVGVEAYFSAKGEARTCFDRIEAAAKGCRSLSELLAWTEKTLRGEEEYRETGELWGQAGRREEQVPKARMESGGEPEDSGKLAISGGGSEKQSATANAPRIMTMHGAKGLEFARVYLPDLNEGVVPTRRAETKAALEEERRLLYVAMTRAKESLTLSCVVGTKENPRPASRFWKEV